MSHTASPHVTLQDALQCVTVSEADFDLSAEVAALRAHDPAVGAVVSFVGTVREWAVSASPIRACEDALALELEHYPGMTERSLAELVMAAYARFDVRRIRIVHRVGRLSVCDQIVLVAVSSAHRGTAFQCAEFLMDWLKTQAPFWKKEMVGDQGRWVDARVTDELAVARWGAFTPMKA